MTWFINFVLVFVLSTFATNYYARKQLTTQFPLAAVVKVTAIASILTALVGFILVNVVPLDVQPGNLEAGGLETFFPYVVTIIQVIVFYASYKYLSQKFLSVPPASQKKFAESVVIFVVVIELLLGAFVVPALVTMLTR